MEAVASLLLALLQLLLLPTACQSLFICLQIGRLMGMPGRTLMEAFPQLLLA
jgi:hypothetical protein